jgi:hypothetical protein
MHKITRGPPIGAPAPGAGRTSGFPKRSVESHLGRRRLRLQTPTMGRHARRGWPLGRDIRPRGFGTHTQHTLLTRLPPKTSLNPMATKHPPGPAMTLGNMRPGRIGLAAILLCAPLVGGCSEEEVVRTCKQQVEQTVLLRQLALPPNAGAAVDSCLANFSPDFCRSTYLDADVLVRDCMSDKGYSFAPIRSLVDYVNPNCYRPTWLVKIESLVRTPANPNSPSAPAFGPCQF